MRTLSKIVVACGILFVAASSATAQDFQWRGFVASGNAIEIKGVNGGVYAQPSADNQVEVIARKTARRSDPAEVQIQVVEHGEGVTICAVYPSRNAAEPNECRPGNEGRMNVQNSDVQVRFTVRVPAGVRLVGHTVNGDVEAMQLQGAVTLKTVNGSVRFSTSETGRAQTVNGSITGALGRADWIDTLDFKTVNGAISLALPQDLNADVDVKTLSGEISTDFAVTVLGRSSRNEFHGTIGSGGRKLSLQTVNGGIELRRN